MSQGITNPIGSDPSRMSDLQERLDRHARWQGIWCWLYDSASDFLTLVAILTGFLVSILLAFDLLRKDAVAILSSVIPGAAIVVVSRLRLSQRGRWHRDKAARLRSLAHRLRQGLDTPRDAAEKYDQILAATPEFPLRDELRETHLTEGIAGETAAAVSAAKKTAGKKKTREGPKKKKTRVTNTSGSAPEPPPAGPGPEASGSSSP